MSRAYNAPTEGYYPVTECEECGTAVIHTYSVILNAQPTVTGAYTRLGFRRHENDIATSRYHDRADGYARHFCDHMKGTS